MERSSTDLLDMLAFVRVAEAGSFAGAAARMGLSKSIVSRRVARLEGELGAKLLTRTASGAQRTATGEDYYVRAAAILADLEAAREAVARAATGLSGPIRLTAPLSFGTAHLAPTLADFAQRHPGIELDILLDDHAVDLVGGGFDLAVRIGNLPDSSLVARRIAPVRRALLGSPAYLAARGTPGAPRDIARHDVLVYSNADRWRFRVGGRWEQVRGTPRLRANNGDLLRTAAASGLGLVILPSFIAAPAIESGALVTLLADYPLEEAGLHALTPPGRAATARVRALVDFLAARFGPEPAWDPCWRAGEAER
ncbi:MAG: Transcriptional regulator, LysR family [uncultured Sphingomonadaceae bacterium]|uniref:Transcriptional regulator, LysR family n=1 Tax=uncultured Sphingomonadaceae bacterium TaxID=169976 RepID=A0A6J4T300_9SPHN|nr:MAG: Transcriptional regulator, LysR family [uncultured Sphingomonadaceae bacterium]